MHPLSSIKLTMPQPVFRMALFGAIGRKPHVAYPGEDGQLKEFHLKQGDFLVQNGNFHEWRNRSGAHCVMFLVLLGTERKGAA